MYRQVGEKSAVLFFFLFLFSDSYSPGKWYFFGGKYVPLNSDGRDDSKIQKLFEASREETD